MYQPLLRGDDLICECGYSLFATIGKQSSYVCRCGARHGAEDIDQEVWCAVRHALCRYHALGNVPDDLDFNEAIRGAELRHDVRRDLMRTVVEPAGCRIVIYKTGRVAVIDNLTRRSG